MPMKRKFLSEGVKYLNSLTNFESKVLPVDCGVDQYGKFQLSRMRDALMRLNNPISRYQVIHIAGSKGKGSVALLLSNILRSSGYRVGTYTSPHIKDIRERIRAPFPKIIDIRDFDKLVLNHKDILQRGDPLTYFETLTALAYVYFAEKKVDFAVVETGMGGLLDATNVIPKENLALSIITTLGWEHVDALGGSLKSISRAKAGILKPSVPLVLGKQNELEAELEVLSEAARIGVPVFKADSPDVKWSTEGVLNFDSGGLTESFDLQVSEKLLISLGMPGSKNLELKNLKLGLIGEHQRMNAAVVVTSCLALGSRGYKIEEKDIREGLSSVRSEGRFQVLTKDEADSLGCKELTVVLDGAHTNESALALSRTLKKTFPGRGVVFLIAMASEKDHAGFLNGLISEVDPVTLIVTHVDIHGSSERSAEPSELGKVFRGVLRSLNQSSHMSLESVYNVAIEKAMLEAKQTQSVLCFTGSLYLVGKVMERIACC